MTITNLIEQYKSYLENYSSNITSTKVGESELGIIYEFNFHFWLSNNDGIHVYVQIQKDKILITDFGETYGEVELCTGIPDKESTTRKDINNILKKIKSYKNIKMSDDTGEIFAEIPLSEASSFPQRLQDFLCTIWSINLILC